MTRTSEGTVSELGLTLYQLRLARGLSLRTLARQLGMASHGGLADYECGRRIPPEDVIHTYERVLGTATTGRAAEVAELRVLETAEVLAIEVQRSSASAGESPSRVNSTV